MNNLYKVFTAVFMLAAISMSAQFLPAENFTPHPADEDLGSIMAVGDMNGDSKEDVIAFVNGDLVVFPALGISFGEGIHFELNLTSIS